MTLDMAQISLALTLAGMAVGVLVAAVQISMRVGVLEFKVATMWAFQMRRGFSEVVATGIGTANSPLKFTPDAIARLDPLKDELIAFGDSALGGVSDADALLLIEAAFGERLLEFVCYPCGLSHGACLLLAFTIATGRNEIAVAPAARRRYRDRVIDLTRAAGNALRGLA
jgi:hypothetical protein